MATHHHNLPRDPEQSFRIKSRRDRLFGLWVASHLGLSGPAADAYARRIMIRDMEAAGEETILHQASVDLDTHAACPQEDALKRQLQRFDALAREQIAREGAPGK